MKRTNFLPNFITAFGLSCGLYVILRVSIAPEGTFQLVYHMTLVLLLAGLADMLDGAVARAVKGESEFGVVFDSLSDAVSFGVAPSVLLLKNHQMPDSQPIAFFLLGSAMLYSLCGVLRLVRFNVKASQAAKDEEEAKMLKRVFIGLPIPAAAAAAVAPNLLLNAPYFKNLFDFSLETNAIILASVMVVIGYLMISRFKFPSVKTIRFRIRSFNLVFLGTVLAILFLYGILHHLPILLTVLSWGYIVVSLFLGLIRVIAGRKHKKLVDFEPADEDDHIDFTE